MVSDLLLIFREHYLPRLLKLSRCELVFEVLYLRLRLVEVLVELDHFAAPLAFLVILRHGVL